MLKSAKCVCGGLKSTRDRRQRPKSKNVRPVSVKAARFWMPRARGPTELLFSGLMRTKSSLFFFLSWKWAFRGTCFLVTRCWTLSPFGPRVDPREGEEAERCWHRCDSPVHGRVQPARRRHQAHAFCFCFCFCPLLLTKKKSAGKKKKQKKVCRL